MGSQSDGNPGPGAGLWAGVGIIAAIAAVVAITSGGEPWVSGLAEATRSASPDVRATCVVPGLPIADLTQDRFGAAPVGCRVGGEIQLTISNSSPQALYPQVVIFAHGTVASYIWPAVAETNRPRLPAGSSAVLLPFRFQLTQRGATIVAALTPEPLSEQQLRAIGRRASSSHRVDGVQTAVFRIEATGVRSPTGRVNARIP